MDTVFVPNPKLNSFSPSDRQLSIMESWNPVSSFASPSTSSSHPLPSDSQPSAQMDTSSPRFSAFPNQKSPSLVPGPSSISPFTSASSNSYSGFPSQAFPNPSLLENPVSRFHDSSPPSSSSSLSSPNQRGLYNHSSQLLSDDLSFDPKGSIPPNELLSSTWSKGPSPNFSPSQDRYTSQAPTSLSKGQLTNPSALANPLRASPNNPEKWNRLSFSESLSPSLSGQTQLFALQQQQQQQQAASVQNSTPFPMQSVRPSTGDVYSSLSTGLSARRPSLNTDNHGRPIPATTLRLPGRSSLNGGSQASPNLQNVALNLSPRHPVAQAPLSADPTFSSFDFLSDNSIWSKASASPTTKYNLSSTAAPSQASDPIVPLSSSRLSGQANNVQNLVSDRLDLANTNGFTPRASRSWARHSASGTSRSSLFSPTTGRVSANLENNLAQLSLKQRSNSASFPSINTANSPIVPEDLVSGGNSFEEMASPNDLAEDRFAWPRGQRRSSITDPKNYRLVPPPLRSSFDVSTNPISMRPTLLSSNRVPSSAPPQTLHFANVPPLSAPLSDVLETDVDAPSAMAQANASASNLLLVEFKAGRTDVFVADAGHLTGVKLSSYVIVEADRGQDLGRVIAKDLSLVEAAARLASLKEEQLAALQAAEGNNGFGAKSDNSVSVTATGLHPKHIYRLAESREVDELASKYQDESQALLVCQAKVRQRKLPMEVLDGEYQWDRKKLTFYYHAKQRIDFRELVRDLFKVYKTRIWMCAVTESNIPPNDSAGASW
ncbi:PSP1 family protein [Schizosaccharomyces octosporus yFS286]|uniref:PSP1 family protein n=1 Tax=Schizosaccharomyces octosporus (strain yFS286) TaxID=483514 RepID=S9QXN7_SCHOY|nr:PSP1 family protein [Schizosaccharomyces octosporus yFS286]EPX71050.1 PSP1 family protein [Schizosaccharomyces octosporus yFS286]